IRDLTVTGVQTCALPIYENAGIVRRQGELAYEAGFLLVRELRQAPLQFGDKRRCQFERQQIGIGEVAVVMRLLFGAHGSRLTLRSEERRVGKEGRSRVCT